MSDNTESIKLLTASAEGRLIGYTNRTHFLVQVGRGRGAYKTKHEIIGDFEKAYALYSAINVSDGYKKRLMMPACARNPRIACVKA
jgi:hypothetical protein